MLKKTDDLTEYYVNISRKNCVYITSIEEAHSLLADVTEAALDFETTALSPEDGEIRLTSICNDDIQFIIDHYFLGHFSDYVEYFIEKRWWVYNAKFECAWLDYYSPDYEIEVLDIDFAKKAKMGGMPTSLAKMAKYDLNITMEKEEQASDWTRPSLTQGQIDYAGFDSYVTWELKKHWWDEELNDEQKKGFHVFNDAVRATIEAEVTGLTLDPLHHAKLIKIWETKHGTFERYIRKWTPKSIIANLNSSQQIGKFLKETLPQELLAVWPRTEKTKQLQIEGSYLRSTSRRLSYPMSRWMAALAGYKYYSKYLSTYGETLLTKQALSGKVTSRYNIAQAATGRYSSSNINGQNIPRKPVVRSSFISPMKGTATMCLADYSGIEVRVLAELSGDEQLLHDAINSDVHSASASQIYDIDLDYFIEVIESKGKGKYANVFPEFKEMRSRAKTFTFRLTYGAGFEVLSDQLKTTYDGAIEAVTKWAERYPKAYDYRNKIFDQMNADGFIPVCDGRTIYVRKPDRTIPVAANYPVQGAAASVMYRAMYHTRKNFIEDDLDAHICATIHDELLSVAHVDDAEDAMWAQLDAMEQGWLDIFPSTSTDNLIEWAIGDDWSCKP